MPIDNSTKNKADHPGGNDVCPDQAAMNCCPQPPDPRRAARGGLGDVAQLGERLPCKQQASGSIPLISTEPLSAAIAQEEAARGNRIGLTGCSVRVSAPGLGPGRRGSSPCFPTSGSLAHLEERRCEIPQARGSSPWGTTYALQALWRCACPPSRRAGFNSPVGLYARR